VSALSRRSFLARAAAAGVATPLLVKAAAAWGDSIDFRPDSLVEDELFVWPNKLVMRGPGAVVRRCAFLGPWEEAGAELLVPETERDTAKVALVILDANRCEISHCYFARCERVTSEDLARAEAWIKGGWRDLPKVDWSGAPLAKAGFRYDRGGWRS